MAVKVEAFRLSGRVEVDNKRAHAQMKESERDARAVASSFKGLRAEVGSLSASVSRGGFLPGLAQISQVIQGLPQIGALAGALVRPLTDAAEAGVRFNAFLETTEKGLKRTLFGGDMGKARAFVNDLRDFAGKTPFRTEPLIKTAQYMTVMGVKAHEVRDELTDVGDAIAATGEISEEAVKSVERAFGKMRSEGRVTAESMEMLTDANIDSWGMLAHAIGKTVAETRKLSETGRLNGPAAVAAIRAEMRARYGGTMKEMEATLTGRLSAAEDAVQAASAKATEGLTLNISEGIGAALQKAGLVDSLAGTINTAITPVAGLIRTSAVGLLGGGLTEGLREGIDAGRSMVTKAVGDFALDSVISPFKSMLGINSPSKVFAELGGFAVDGFAFGSGGKGGLASEESKEKLRKAVQELATDPRIRAWFEVIRQVEGGQPDVMAGGAHVKSGRRHPGQIVPRSEWFRGQKGPSSAAGNWQITLTNWMKWAPILGLDDFSDVNQQMMVALALFIEGGGDVSLLKGDMKGALKASRPWAATPLSHLPGSKPLSADKFVERYQGLLGGGGVSSAPVPVRIVASDAAVGKSDFGLQDSTPLARTVASLDTPIEDVRLGMNELGVLLPQATASTGLGLRMLEAQARESGERMALAAGHAAASVIGSAKKMDSVMGAFGQIAGMLPGGQQVGKKRGFFSKVLGFAAPFLNFIPGVGPILSTLAGIGSSALGGDYGAAVAGAAGGFSTGGVFRRSSSSSSTGSTSTVNVGAGLEPRALGGPVKRGRTYIVGEHQAEVFSPDEDGFIHPSTAAYGRSRGGAQGRGVTGSVLARVAAALESFESIPHDEVVRKGLKARPDLATNAFMQHGARDPRVVEWMQRRTQAA